MRLKRAVFLVQQVRGEMDNEPSKAKDVGLASFKALARANDSNYNARICKIAYLQSL